MVGFILLDLVQQRISMALALVSFLAGILLGVLMNRMYRFEWDDQAQKVIARIDWIGGVILAVYIGFTLSRNWIFGHWLQGATLTAFGLCLTAGSRLGRVLGTARGIRVRLKSVGIRLRQ